MYADLVGPSGFKAAADMGKVVIRGNQVPMSDSGLGILLGHSHPLAVDRVAANGPVYGAGVCFKTAMGDGLVNAG